MAFRNTLVCFTGLSSDEKVFHEERIRSMGGNVKPELTQNVDILIAKNCETTDKYRAACCWRIPICGVSLIDEMLKMNKGNVSEFVNATRNDYSLSIFSDCVICSSGVTTEERTVIGQAVEENGGRYVLDLTRGEATHLITEKLNGEKYKHARLWGIKIVNMRWLRKSLHRGIRLPEEYYNPDPALNKTVTKSKQIGNDEAAVLSTQSTTSIAETPCLARKSKFQQMSDNVIMANEQQTQDLVKSNSQFDSSVTAASQSTTDLATGLELPQMTSFDTQLEEEEEKNEEPNQDLTTELALPADVTFVVVQKEPISEEASQNSTTEFATAKDDETLGDLIEQPKLEDELVKVLEAEDKSDELDVDKTQVQTTQSSLANEQPVLENPVVHSLTENLVQPQETESVVVETEQVAVEMETEVAKESEVANVTIVVSRSACVAMNEISTINAPQQFDETTEFTLEPSLEGTLIGLALNSPTAQDFPSTANTSKKQTLEHTTEPHIAYLTAIETDDQVPEVGENITIISQPISMEDEVEVHTALPGPADVSDLSPQVSPASKPRRIRMRINTQKWTTKLLDVSASSHESADDSADATLGPDYIQSALAKAAGNVPKALRPSQIPEEMRACVRQSVLQPPHCVASSNGKENWEPSDRRV